MSYTKNIAVIKGLQSGFSADGGALSGLVKAERYSSELRVEISLINFAPLSEGRYVTALSDGPHTQIIEGGSFEGYSAVDTSRGFAAAVCFVNGGVQLIATAVCGDFQSAVFGLKGEIERAERIKAPIPQENENVTVQRYEDEALAEENYYEFDASFEGGQPVCQNTQKEEDGGELCKNEKDSVPVEEVQNSVDDNSLNIQNAIHIDILQQNAQPDGEEAKNSNLARGGFYKKMKEQIEGLLSAYPPAEELCAAIEGSKWVKIPYGEDKFYVFGVISDQGVPKYICYGLPAADGEAPPASMQGFASFLSVKTPNGVGFWMMYQDAETGASIQISQQ